MNGHGGVKAWDDTSPSFVGVIRSPVTVLPVVDGAFDFAQWQTDQLVERIPQADPTAVDDFEQLSGWQAKSVRARMPEPIATDDSEQLSEWQAALLVSPPALRQFVAATIAENNSLHRQLAARDAATERRVRPSDN